MKPYIISSKLFGRVTTVLEYPAVKEETVDGANGTPIGHEAFSVCKRADEYTITVDSHGKFLRKSNETDGHPVISIVTEDVSKEYLDSLTNQGILKLDSAEKWDTDIVWLRYIMEKQSA